MFELLLAVGSVESHYLLELHSNIPLCNSLSLTHPATTFNGLWEGTGREIVMIIQDSFSIELGVICLSITSDTIAKYMPVHQNASCSNTPTSK